MGVKFANLQVRTTDIESVKALLKQGETATQLAQDWISILFDEVDFNKESSRARAISKVMPNLVMCITYFDDDILDISVFHHGKLACSYRNNEGKKLLSKPTIWEKEFQLEADEMKALRLIPQTNDDASCDLDRISMITGSVLYLSMDILHYYQQKDLFKQSKESVATFLQQQKELTKVRNQTRAMLRYETEGILESYSLVNNHCFAKMVLADKEGYYQHDHIHCYQLHEDHAAPMYDFNYPKEFFPEGTKQLIQIPLDQNRIHLHPLYGPNFGYGDFEVDATDFESALYGDKAHLLSIYHNPWYQRQQELQMKHDCFKIRWSAQAYYLDKLLPDGSVQTSYMLPAKPASDRILMLDNKIICFCHVRKEESMSTTVLVFDLDLQVLYYSDLGLYVNVSEYVYSNYHHALYLIGYYNKQIGAFSLDNFSFRSNKLLSNGYCFYWGWDTKHNLLLREGNSTLIIVDHSLHVISRHKLKGDITAHFISNNNLYVVTGNGSIYQDKAPSPSPRMRVYEIIYLP